MSTLWGNGFTTPPQSYWISSVKFPQFEHLNGDVDVDVAIVGGGITGIASAFMLKQTGLKVAVLEADKILHGTTGHTTGKITAQHDIIYSTIKANMGQENAQQYADANKAAISAMDKIIREHNIQCDFSWQSAYVYTQDDKEIQKVQAEADAAASLGFAATYLEQIPLPIDVKAALRFDNQAQFHPLKFLLAVADLIPGNGSYIFENTQALGIQTDNGYALTTGTGYRVKASNVVIASHYPFYDGGGMYYTRVNPSRSYAIGATIDGKYPGGVYVTVDNPVRSFRSTPLANGKELVLVVGEHHNTGQDDNSNVHYWNLIDTAVSVFQLDEVLYRWSAQDYTTLDQVPYIGSLSPGIPGVYVATGFRKWGISTAMVAAMILKDSIIGVKNPWAEVFDPLRFKPDAATENAMAQKTNFSESLTKNKLISVADIDVIGPDEAGVFEIDGITGGVYRDHYGELHIVETSCTHMGCKPQWNPAEKSWDCPCHGSRFTCEGEVIEGPAKMALNRPEAADTLWHSLQSDQPVVKIDPTAFQVPTESSDTQPTER